MARYSLPQTNVDRIVVIVCSLFWEYAMEKRLGSFKIQKCKRPVISRAIRDSNSTGDK